MKPLSPQARIVRDHLQQYAHLTHWQAEGVYHIRRLASRVDELRAHGYVVETTTCEDAKGQRYTRYSFSKAQRRAKRPLGQPRTKTKRYTAAAIAALYESYCENELGLSGLELQLETSAFLNYIGADA